MPVGVYSRLSGDQIRERLEKPHAFLRIPAIGKKLSIK